MKNSEKTVRRTIESILNQKYPHELMEIVIVDGCSRDRTLPILASVTSRTHVRARVYSDEGRGLGYARQMVVDRAAGRYIVFVDSDVQLLGGFIQRQVEFMDANPRVGVAVGKYMHQEGPPISLLLSLYNHITWTDYFGNDATIYRPQAIKAAGGFDENIKGACEDLDMITRIQANGWLHCVNANAAFYHTSRDALREFWTEQTWFGYGEHYISHKHKNPFDRRRHLPIESLVYRLRLAAKAYEFSRRRLSFFMPILLAFGGMAWWMGFIRAHVDGYGHGIDLVSSNKDGSRRTHLRVCAF
ncbi:glycosyltransferase [Candidatus Bathyarchaeota archaeon]|nr:glycosyltransferase [Candidatus Bathyarchaeota archaeon]